MQSVSSRIWTRVAVSISYDDNDYTTGTSSWVIMEKFKDNKKIMKAGYEVAARESGFYLSVSTRW